MGTSKHKDLPFRFEEELDLAGSADGDRVMVSMDFMITMLFESCSIAKTNCRRIWRERDPERVG